MMYILCQRIAEGGKYRWPEDPDTEEEALQAAKDLLTGKKRWLP